MYNIKSKLIILVFVGFRCYIMKVFVLNEGICYCSLEGFCICFMLGIKDIVSLCEVDV